MIIVDTQNLNDKERVSLPESLKIHSEDGFFIYDTDTMVRTKMKGCEIRNLLYQGYKVNGFTYNTYFCCYDYDKDWYKQGILIKMDIGYYYLIDDMEICYRMGDGALIYRLTKYRTDTFVTFCLSAHPYKKYRGSFEGEFSYHIVAKGLSEENFLYSYKDMPVKVKLLGKKV